VYTSTFKSLIERGLRIIYYSAHRCICSIVGGRLRFTRANNRWTPYSIISRQKNRVLAVSSPLYLLYKCSDHSDRISYLRIKFVHIYPSFVQKWWWHRMRVYMIIPTTMIQVLIFYYYPARATAYVLYRCSTRITQTPPSWRCGDKAHIYRHAAAHTTYAVTRRGL